MTRTWWYRAHQLILLARAGNALGYVYAADLIEEADGVSGRFRPAGVQWFAGGRGKERVSSRLEYRLAAESQTGQNWIMSLEGCRSRTSIRKLFPVISLFMNGQFQ
ncbi:hypothetical protein BDV29DRAFT_63523 [Aspergillus leporis]|uniref:Uncharacterized protein n=1 Tax=Aspergillus leporis TaxID=41062 RepID=A0A5N5WKF7_9EURO|nr:hypothetical protein BDV29DRAFT_63523 [Aspergillus leporis]